MAKPATFSGPIGLRTAVTVMNSADGPAPCPFFGRCDGILVFDSETGAREFHANPPRTPETLCDLIVAVRPDRLVCGYIGEAERKRLDAAGIDVRLGSCACSVSELATCFSDLPEA